MRRILNSEYITKDIARYNAMKDKRNIVSLNYAQREKENEEDDAIRLARINDRLKREGKPPLKKLDDLPKDYQEPDPYLDENGPYRGRPGALEKRARRWNRRPANKLLTGTLRGALFLCALSSPFSSSNKMSTCAAAVSKMLQNVKLCFYRDLAGVDG